MVRLACEPWDFITLCGTGKRINVSWLLPVVWLRHTVHSTIQFTCILNKSSIECLRVRFERRLYLSAAYRTWHWRCGNKPDKYNSQSYWYFTASRGHWGWVSGSSWRNCCKFPGELFSIASATDDTRAQVLHHLPLSQWFPLSSCNIHVPTRHRLTRGTCNKACNAEAM